MRWVEKVIAAHKHSLIEGFPDRRAALIATWEQYQSSGKSASALVLAKELATQGNANETELGFYVLMELALNDASIRCHIKNLSQNGLFAEGVLR